MKAKFKDFLVLSEMSDYMTDYEQDMSKLPRNERISIRNQVILMKVATGSTKTEIQNKFKLSERQIYRILQDAQIESAEWYESLPKEKMLQIFRYNSQKTFKEILRLERIRNEGKDDKQTEFNMTKDIIDAYIKYDRMVAEGPTLTRQKELTEKVERILEKNAE